MTRPNFWRNNRRTRNSASPNISALFAQNGTLLEENMPVFDYIVIVDWSASGKLNRGPDSIWYCFLAREGDHLTIIRIANPSSRQAALQELQAILLDCLRKDK